MSLIQAAFLLAAVAPQDVPQRVHAPVVHVGTYDLDSQSFERSVFDAAEGGGGSVVDFDNSATNGFTFLPGAGVGVRDWGIYTPSGNGLLYRFTVGYSTVANGPIDLTVNLYSGTTGSCAGPGTLLGSFPLTGLPGSDGITPVANTVTVTTRTSGIAVPAGPIGWEYRFFDVKSGPLLVNGPLGLPAPNGTVDLYDRVDLGFGGCTSQNFGGCLPPFLPCASFYLTLEADDGSVSASVVPYGSGVNPVGSLSVLAGTGSIGATTVLGVNNPLGTQTPGSFAFLALSFAPDVNFPAGTLLPFFGMSGPFASSELLIALPQALLLGPSIWAGPSFPSAFPITIPQNVNFIGAKAYFQGGLIDLVAPFGVDIAFTDALEMTVGP